MKAKHYTTTLKHQEPRDIVDYCLQEFPGNIDKATEFITAALLDYPIRVQPNCTTVLDNVEPFNEVSKIWA